MLKNPWEIRGKLTHRRQWDNLRADWADCRKCKIGRFYKGEHAVLGRGFVPCDIAVVGEAPGRDEMRHGLPFVGRSGDLLVTGLEEAMRKVWIWSPPPRLLITNLCACRPTDSETGGNRAPTEGERRRCKRRLVQTLEIAEPLAVLYIGGTAAREGLRHCTKPRCIDYLRGQCAYCSQKRIMGDNGAIRSVSRHYPAALLASSVYHPAYILRQGGLGSSAYRHWVSSLVNYFKLFMVEVGRRSQLQESSNA